MKRFTATLLTVLALMGMAKGCEKDPKLNPHELPRVSSSPKA